MSNIIDKAIRIAMEAHEGQYRKDNGLPYIVHPIQVMQTINRWGTTNELILAAAVLHDTLEDTDLSQLRIYHEFGPLILDFVNELTFDEVKYHDKAEYLRSFKNKSGGAVIIKVADRVCNIWDFYHDGNEKYARKYFMRACDLFNLYVDKFGPGPGVWAINELDETLFPERYQ